MQQPVQNLESKIKDLWPKDGPSSLEVKDDRSGWQAEDQIAVEYLAACVEAVENDDAFANFKSNPKYKTILEHVLKDQGQAYLNICKDMNEDAVWENIEAFKENDKIGNPETHVYPGVDGVISATTLRYMKNTFEMAFMMDGAEIGKVVEVGGGYSWDYSGLLWIIVDYRGLSWIIVDHSGL